MATKLVVNKAAARKVVNALYAANTRIYSSDGVTGSVPKNYYGIAQVPQSEINFWTSISRGIAKLTSRINRKYKTG